MFNAIVFMVSSVFSCPCRSVGLPHCNALLLPQLVSRRSKVHWDAIDKLKVKELVARYTLCTQQQPNASLAL